MMRSRWARYRSLIYLAVLSAVFGGCASPQATNSPEKIHSFANGICIVLCLYQYQEADSNAGSTITESQTQTPTLNLPSDEGVKSDADSDTIPAVDQSLL